MILTSDEFDRLKIRLQAAAASSVPTPVTLTKNEAIFILGYLEDVRGVRVEGDSMDPKA